MTLLPNAWEVEYCAAGCGRYTGVPVTLCDPCRAQLPEDLHRRLYDAGAATPGRENPLVERGARSAEYDEWFAIALRCLTGRTPA